MMNSFRIFHHRETNLKFKFGLRVTDEKLQEERQLAEFDGKTVFHTCMKYVLHM